MKKLINDTLKSPSGKWSRKSLTMFVSFVILIVMWLLDQVFQLKVSEFIFWGFTSLAGGISLMTVLDKYSNEKDVV